MSSPKTGTAVAGLEPVSPLIPDLIWALSSADSDLKTSNLAEILRKIEILPQTSIFCLDRDKGFPKRGIG